MILLVRGRIRGLTGGCWGWCSELEEGFYTEFTEKQRHRGHGEE